MDWFLWYLIGLLGGIILGSIFGAEITARALRRRLLIKFYLLREIPLIGHGTINWDKLEAIILEHK